MVCIKLQSRKSIWIITSVPISDIWDVHLIHMMIVTSLPVLIVVMELLFLGLIKSGEISLHLVVPGD